MAVNLLLISSSRVLGFDYLENAKDAIQELLNSKDVKTVLFVPYASNDYAQYLNTVKPVFKDFGYEIEGIHEHESPTTAVKEAEAIFIGGGNTFLLLNTLYSHKGLVDAIKTRVLKESMPYIGSSAGTNVSTINIHTTNDMPIIYPPSFEALSLVPFNINPHYLDPRPEDPHQGETRDQRIEEYLKQEHANKYVLALREGSMLSVSGNKATLLGRDSKLFIKGQPTQEYKGGADLSFLLQ